MNEQDIIDIVKNDQWMMNVLNESNKLNLPDWAIGAGFLRNKVWDYLHDIKRTVADTSDIDLVYFDETNADEEYDKKISKSMKGILGLDWEIINQAYTHKWHNRDVPYSNTAEALSEWVETATSVGVTMVDGELKIVAPHGIEDLVNLIIRPVPIYRKDMDVFYTIKE